MKRENLGDGWYESEEPTRVGMVTELQRIRRRTGVRPIPVLLLAVLVTAAVTYKIATKPRIYEGEVVLALTEGVMSGKSNIPFQELKGYVASVLMPDAKLLELIEKRDLHRLRKKFGNQYALTELRDQIEVEIWKNSFTYYSEEDIYAQKSARIGITVIESDPDLAYELAHDLASIVIASHEEERLKTAEALAREVSLIRITMEGRLADVDASISAKLAQQEEARLDGKSGVYAALAVDLSALKAERKAMTARMQLISQSPEAVADQVTRAGLDTSLSVVGERRPERQEQNLFVLIIIVVVVGTGALIGSAVFVGAFDARVHDTDDVSRLGLPVLGHVPGFPGDQVGSLGARGARRPRVPSFLRWRSHR